MNAPQFTPGPWSVENTASQSDRWMVMAPHPYSDAHKYGVARGIEHADDAHLIAAAPELYEALATILANYVDLLAEKDAYPETDSNVYYSRAALAKARGETL